MGNWAEIILANTGSGTYVPPSNAPNVSFAAAPTVSWVPYGHDWIPWITFTLNLPTTDAAYTNLRDIQITRIGPDVLDATGKRLVVDTIPHGLFVGTSITLKYDLPPISEYSAHTWKIVASVRNDLTITTASAPSQTVTVTPPQVASVTASEKFTSTLGDLRYHPDDGAGLMTQLLVTPTLTFQPGTQQSVTIWTVYDWGGTFGIRTTFKGWSWISGTSLAVTFSGNEGLWVTTKASTTVTVRCAIGAIDPLAPIPAGAASTTFTLYGPGGAAGLGNTDITGSLLGVNYFRKSGGSDWGWKGITGANPVKADVWFARFYLARGTWVSGTQTWTDDSGYCPLNAETGRFDWNVGDSEDDTVTTARDAGGNPIPGQPFTTVASPPLDFAPPGATTNKQFCLRVKIFSRKDGDPGIDGAFWTGSAPTYAEYSTDHKICIITPDNTKAGLNALDIPIGQGLYVDDGGVITENTGWNPSQMLPNGSFEDGTSGTYTGGGTAGTGPFAAGQGLPSGWTVNPPLNPPHNPGVTTSGLTIVTTPVLSGSKAVQLTGSHTQLIPSDKFICRVGDAFYAECWIQSTTSPTPNGVFRIAIFFYDTTGALIGASIVLRDYPTGSEVLPGVQWKKVTSTAQAPSGAAYMNVVFGTSGTTTGSWYLDNAMVRPILPSDVVQHGASVGSDANGNLVVNTDGTTLGTAAGTVTVSGTTVTWVSGGQFSGTAGPPPTGMWGQSIVINTQTYTVTAVTDRTHLTINTSLSYGTPVAYSIGSVVLIPAGAVNVENVFPGTLGSFLNAAGQQVYGSGSGQARPMAIGFGLPVPSSTYPKGALFFNLADGKVYRNSGGAVTSITVNNVGSGYVINNILLFSPPGGGGTGCQIQVQIGPAGSIVNTPAGYSVGITDQGQDYSSSFSFTVPGTSGTSASLTLNVGAVGTANAWVVAVKAQDVLAGTIAAATGYFGLVNAAQVTAGLFTGCSLDLDFNGVRTTINNGTDPYSGRATCYKSTNSAGNVALVDPTAFQLYKTPSAGTSGNPTSFYYPNQWFMGDNAGTNITIQYHTSPYNYISLIINRYDGAQILMDFVSAAGGPRIVVQDPGATNYVSITPAGILHNGVNLVFP